VFDDSQFEGKAHFDTVDGFVVLQPKSVYLQVIDFYEYGADLEYKDLLDNLSISEEVKKEIIRKISDEIF
jgi:hypothetical protein